MNCIQRVKKGFNDFFKQANLVELRMTNEENEYTMMIDIQSKCMK